MEFPNETCKCKWIMRRQLHWESHTKAPFFKENQTCNKLNTCWLRKGLGKPHQQYQSEIATQKHTHTHTHTHTQTKGQCWTINGELPMVTCKWAMGNCQWSMVNGEWSLANGQRPIGNGQWWFGIIGKCSVFWLKKRKLAKLQGFKCERSMVNGQWPVVIGNHEKSKWF